MFYEPLIVNKIPYRAYVGTCKSYRRHWHSELELLICLEGQLLVHLENREFLLEVGDAIVLPGYEVHAVSPENAYTRRIAIAFGYSLLGIEFPSIQSTCLLIPAAQDTPQVLRLSIQTICRCLTEQGCVCPKNEWQLRGALYLLAGHLQTLPPAVNISEDLQGRIRRLSNIYAVLDHVAQHYMESISVEEAAQIAGYASTYFCRQFKNIIGSSFHRYLTRYRISVACLLLEDSSQPIGTVAEAVGFSSLRLFCRTFKELTGHTPTHYQHLSPDEKDASWLL